MGQGQSQSDKSLASNHTNTSKVKKGKRRSSNKGSQSSRGAGHSSQSSVTSNGRKEPSLIADTSETASQSDKMPLTHQELQLVGVNHNNSSTTRGSAGAERSVPSRQFSLNRQTQPQSLPNKHAQIEKYFNKYKDVNEDAILAEGMERFCIDLGVDPTEFIVLVLAWKFEASQMCRFTREEFINGCQKMQAHNVKSLRERFPELLAQAKNEKNFKGLYNFTFSFGLDHTCGQRSLPMEMAIALWNLVFTQNRPDLLDRWFEFLKDGEVRGVSRDTWNMFLPFVDTTLPDLSNYDESEAWPSLFDDFVEGEQEKTTL